MDVERRFPRVVFQPSLIRRALAELADLPIPKDDKERGPTSTHLSYQRDGELWSPDDIEEWLAEIASSPAPTYYRGTVAWGYGDFSLSVSQERGTTRVSITAAKKSQVQRLLNLFKDAEESSRLPDEPEPEYTPPRPVVFIGHGHSGDWRKIKDHLQDKQGYKVEAYEVGSRAGHTIRDVLSTMMRGSAFALLVMTGEDEGEGDLKRARQNVVHETGLFQGTLGFHRAIAVVEEGVEVFSNLNGVDQIRYPRGHVANSFGEILATLRREFGDTR